MPVISFTSMCCFYFLKYGIIGGHLKIIRTNVFSSLLANATGYSRVHIAPEDLPVGLRGTVRDTQDAQFQRRPVSFNVKQLRFNVSIERRISS